MATTVFPQTDAISFGGFGIGGSLKTQLERTGRMPPVTLVIKPLGLLPDITLNRFLSYQFTSSILIPVDTFSFNFVAPDDNFPLNSTIRSGDIVVLSANNVQLAQGIIDTTEVETDGEFGEKGAISGRDLMSQLEDQDAINLDSRPIFAQQISVQNGVRALLTNTRINNVEMRGAPSATYLLATEPGESKLAALQRFLEPLNCLAWMGAAGQIIVGKPNFKQPRKGRIVLSKARRESNVLHMKVVRSATQIPNVIVPIWSGQELVTEAVPVQQRLYNAAEGPSRLFKTGHRVIKSCVVSAPNADSAQGLSDVNAIRAGGGNLLQSYAKREIARANQKEMIVQAVVPGHFNDAGEPYVVDTIYQVEYDRGGVNEAMYLFQVDYTMDEASGQKTNLYFCRLGTIVSDVVAP
jgi:prophage tail gpP-like protein